LRETPDGLDCRVAAGAVPYDPTTLERWIARSFARLEAAAADPETPLSRFAS